MSGRGQFVLAFGLCAVSGCIESSTAPPQSAKLEDVFDLPKLRSIGSAINKTRDDKLLPGGVLWVERNGVHFTKAYGKASVDPIHSPAQTDTLRRRLAHQGDRHLTRRAAVARARQPQYR